MDGIELIAFQIISTVGAARSSYIEAIHEAKKGNFEAAAQLIAEGKEMFTQGHHAHGDLIAKEADGEKTDICLLLLHAEDQLMSAEAFGILAEEFVGVYQTIYGLNK